MHNSAHLMVSCPAVSASRWSAERMTPVIFRENERERRRGRRRGREGEGERDRGRMEVCVRERERTREHARECTSAS